MTLIIILFMSLLIAITRFLISDRLSKIIISLYLMWWTMWLTLSTLNVYDLFPVSIKTYFLLLLNIAMVLMGFLYGSIFSSRNRINNVYLNDIKVSMNKAFKILLIGSVAILTYYYIKYMTISISSPGLDLRMERFRVGLLFSSTEELLFFYYFIEAFVYVLYAVVAYMIFYKDIKNITFAMALGSILLYAGVGSGRGQIIYLLVAIALVYFIRTKDIKKNVSTINQITQVRSKKNKKTRIFSLFAIFIPGVLVYAAWLTAVRLGFREFNIEAIQIGADELFKQFIVYYTGPFRALDYGLEHFVPNTGYLWGRGTFAGIDEIINMAFHVIGLNFKSANGIIGEMLQETQILIGYNQTFNYAYTSVMIHYFDLGIAGVIVFPFLYGLFVRISIFLFQKTPSLPTLIIVVFLFQTMIFSVFSWGLQSPASNIVLISCYLWHRYTNKKVKRIKNNSVDV